MSVASSLTLHPLVQTWVFNTHEVELFDLTPLQDHLSDVSSNLKKSSPDMPEVYKQWDAALKLCHQAKSSDILDGIYSQYGPLSRKRKASDLSENGEELFNTWEKDTPSLLKRARVIDSALEQLSNSILALSSSPSDRNPLAKISYYRLVKTNIKNDEEPITGWCSPDNSMDVLLSSDPYPEPQSYDQFEQGEIVHSLLKEPVATGKNHIHFALLRRNEPVNPPKPLMWRITNSEVKKRSWHYAEQNTDIILDELKNLNKMVMATELTSVLVTTMKAQLDIVLTTCIDDLTRQIEFKIFHQNPHKIEPGMIDKNKLEEIKIDLAQIAFESAGKYFQIEELELTPIQFSDLIDIDALSSQIESEPAQFMPIPFGTPNIPLVRILGEVRGLAMGKYFRTIMNQLVVSILINKLSSLINQEMDDCLYDPKQKEKNLVSRLENIVTNVLEKGLYLARSPFEWLKAPYEKLEALRVPLNPANLFNSIENGQRAYFGMWRARFDIKKPLSIESKISLVAISRLGQRILDENYWAVSLFSLGTSSGCTVIQGGHAMICIEGLKNGKYYRKYADIKKGDGDKGSVRWFSTEDILQDRYLNDINKSKLSKTWRTNSADVKEMIKAIKTDIQSPPLFNMGRDINLLITSTKSYFMKFLGKANAENIQNDEYHCIAWAMKTCKIAKIVLPGRGLLTMLPNDYIRRLNTIPDPNPLTLPEYDNCYPLRASE